jgi:adenylate cyclase
MADPRPVSLDPQLVPTVEVIERPSAERPIHDSLDAIGEWLVGPARRAPSGLRAFDEFSWRMLAAGLPLLRVALHVSTLHPQYLGATFAWFRSTGQTSFRLIAHELAEKIRYEDNPVARVVIGGETLRRQIVADAVLDFPILHDLKEQGATDYLALPVPSAHSARNYMVSYVTDRAGGFTESQVADVTGVSQRLPVLLDMFSQRAIARNVLSAYLGSKTGPKVLDGQIRRGTGEEISAVLWSSDLRGFTERSDRLPGQRMIALLNALFDAQAKAIHEHGGGAELVAQDEPPLQIVVALHAGTVIYGNIGAANRLDFTVIGPAVNLVSRIEAVAKTLNLPIVVSDDFACLYGKPLQSLGLHRLRGLSMPHELFAPQIAVP